MDFDRWGLYRLMLHSRLFEQAVQELWEAGHISGEMHLGTGEEAIVAAIVSQLRDGDAMALDHRGTPAMVMRGVDTRELLDEFLGRPTGVCRGMGGHMHVYSREHRFASSGIVGASGPTAAGFAMSATHLRPGTVAVAFFGEGAINQGMLMEAMNLTAAWDLPVLFVCKDNDWAITTESSSLTGGTPTGRARGFDIPAVEVDGTDVEAMWDVAHAALDAIRAGGGPQFIHAHCVHLEGHFLHDPLLTLVRHPLRELSGDVVQLTRSVLGSGGGSIGDRATNVGSIAKAIRDTYRDTSHFEDNDPVRKLRAELSSDSDKLEALEAEVAADVQAVIESAMEGA